MSFDFDRKISLLISRPVTVTSDSGRVCHATMTSLSTTGIIIGYEAPGEKGTEVEVDFKLQLNDYQQHIINRGLVVYSHLKEDQYTIGISFKEISDKYVKAINRFIALINDIRNQ